MAVATVYPDGPMPSRLGVVAMGKGGARELNYSSDIDLIVFFDRTATSLAEDIEPQPFFVRVTQAMARMLQQRSGEGYVFRVDLRLRPDPASTQVAISTDAALHYYEREGRTWERAAMIKARPCAGDPKAGDALIGELAPFVWRKHLDFAALAEAVAAHHDDILSHYGRDLGLRVARKHLGWYANAAGLPDLRAARAALMAAAAPAAAAAAIRAVFSGAPGARQAA